MADDVTVSSKSYEIPPEGVHQAVVVDIVDLGMKETPWGMKPKVRIVFELDKKKRDGKPFTAIKQFTAVLGEKANLDRFIAAIRGKALSADERVKFRLSSLVGLSCQLLLQHEEKNGKRFANITTGLKAGENPYIASGTYKRPEPKAEGAPSVKPAAEQIPF